MSSILPELVGGPELVSWFGRVPRFHDAEVLSLRLARDGESSFRVHTWNMTSAVDERGFFILDKHVVVTFLLQSISGLRLDGFSGQNVINALTVRRYTGACDVLGQEFFSCDPPGDDDFGLILEATYGVGGAIYAKDVRVTFEPEAPSL